MAETAFKNRLAVFFHILAWTQGLWAWALVVYLLRRTYASATVMALYLAYIFIGPGLRHVHRADYPTPFRRCASCQRKAPGGVCGGILRHTSRCTFTRQRSWTLRATMCSGSIRTASCACPPGCPSPLKPARFPGIQPHVLTLVPNLRTPFLREYLLLHGVSDCSHKTCATILRRGPGQSILLAVGGAAESLQVEPGTFNVVLGRRKGFVRLALQTGASLVPVVSFGENDMFQVWRPKPGTWYANVQSFFLKTMGFTVPYAYGRGLFLGKGLLPLQTPINVVVGTPIPCSAFAGDTHSPEGQAAVEELHARYVAQLRGLWDKYKNRYALQRKGTFRMVG